MRKKVIETYKIYGSGGDFLECTLECGHIETWSRHTAEGWLAAPKTMTCRQCEIDSKSPDLTSKKAKFDPLAETIRKSDPFAI